MAKRRLEVLLTGEGKQVRQMFDKSAQSGGKFGRAMGKAGRAAKAAAVGIAAVGAAAVAGGLKVLQMGASYEDLDQKAETVFEGQLPAVRKWASEQAGAMGLTARQLTGLTANFADLLKPMGFTAEQAAEMAQETNELSGALSMWSGGTVDAAGASEILSKAMLGEREGLKQLGISISEADVQARLAAKGQGELTGAAREQAEAVATQELIMDKSTDAQKRWEEGQDSLSVKLNEAKARMQELKERGIELLLPFVVEAFEKMQHWGQVVSERLTPVLRDLQAWWEANGPAIIATAQELWAGVQAAFDGIVGAVQTVIGWFQQGEGEATSAFAGIQAFAAEVWPQISGIVTSASEAIAAIVRWVVGVVTTFWERFGTHIIQFTQGTWENIKQIIDAVLRVIKGIFDVFAGIFTGDWSRVWEGIKAIFSGVWSAIHAILSQAVENIKLVLGAALAAISQLWEAAWNTVKTLARNAWDAIVGVVRDKIDQTVDEIRTIKDFVTDFFADAGNWLIGAGKDLIRGVWDGIKSMGSWLVRKLSSWVEDKIPAPIRRALGMSSPSKVAMDIGGNFAGSLAAGIDRQRSDVQKAVDRLTSVDASMPDVDLGRVRGGDGAAAGRSVTVARDAIRIEVTVNGDADPTQVRDAVKDPVDEALDRLLDELGAS